MPHQTTDTVFQRQSGCDHTPLEFLGAPALPFPITDDYIFLYERWWSYSDWGSSKPVPHDAVKKTCEDFDSAKQESRRVAVTAEKNFSQLHHQRGSYCKTCWPWKDRMLEWASSANEPVGLSKMCSPKSTLMLNYGLRPQSHTLHLKAKNVGSSPHLSCRGQVLIDSVQGKRERVPEWGVHQVETRNAVIHCKGKYRNHVMF